MVNVTIDQVFFLTFSVNKDKAANDKKSKKNQSLKNIAIINVNCKISSRRSLLINVLHVELNVSCRCVTNEWRTSDKNEYVHDGASSTKCRSCDSITFIYSKYTCWITISVPKFLVWLALEELNCLFTVMKPTSLFSQFLSFVSLPSVLFYTTNY